MLEAVHPHPRARLLHLDVLDRFVIGSHVDVLQKHRLPENETNMSRARQTTVAGRGAKCEGQELRHKKVKDPQSPAGETLPQNELLSLTLHRALLLCVFAISARNRAVSYSGPSWELHRKTLTKIPHAQEYNHHRRRTTTRLFLAELFSGLLSQDGDLESTRARRKPPERKKQQVKEGSTKS